MVDGSRSSFILVSLVESDTHSFKAWVFVTFRSGAVEKPIHRTLRCFAPLRFVTFRSKAWVFVTFRSRARENADTSDQKGALTASMGSHGPYVSRPTFRTFRAKALRKRHVLGLRFEIHVPAVTLRRTFRTAAKWMNAEIITLPSLFSHCYRVPLTVCCRLPFPTVSNRYRLPCLSDTGKNNDCGGGNVDFAT